MRLHNKLFVIDPLSHTHCGYWPCTLTALAAVHNLLGNTKVQTYTSHYQPFIDIRCNLVLCLWHGEFLREKYIPSSASASLLLYFSRMPDYIVLNVNSSLFQQPLLHNWQNTLQSLIFENVWCQHPNLVKALLTKDKINPLISYILKKVANQNLYNTKNVFFDYQVKYNLCSWRKIMSWNEWEKM